MKGDGTTVYGPHSALRAPGSLLRALWADIKASRGLAWRLAQRDIRAQYRGSYLSYAWAFITPLASTLVWIFLNRTGIVKVSDAGMPYAAFVFSGTMLWQVFTESLSMPLVQLIGAKSMMAKLNFPREALLVSGAIKLGWSAAVKCVILVPAIWLLGVSPDVHLVLFPLAVAMIVLAGFSLGLLLAPIGLLYSDISRGLPVVAQFLMFVSPVLYPAPSAGVLGKIMLFNPMAPLITTARGWLTGTATADPAGFVIVSGLLGVFLFLGLVLYRITLPVLIERISS